MFAYFPDNYMWSAAFLRCLNSGGVIGELHQVGERLVEASTKPPVGDLEAWHAEWYRLASQVEAAADTAARSGRKATAREHYHRASQYYQWAAGFLPASDPRKKSGYCKRLDCFHQALALMPHPVEIVDVPYEGGPLPGYFVPPMVSAAKPWPVAVFFDGLGLGDKEEFFPVAVALAERGVSCLAVDAPGMGGALNLRGIIGRPDSEVPARALYEYLAGRPDVDGSRVGIVGLSLGGYYAPRAVAFEKRFKACVAWGGIYDYHNAWQRRLHVQPDSALSSPPHGLFAHLGVDNWDEALPRLKAFSLRGIAEQIECDFLLIHGEDDRQTPLIDALALYGEVGSERKELKVYALPEGGSSHCQIDYVEPARSFVADWLAEHL